MHVHVFVCGCLCVPTHARVLFFDSNYVDLLSDSPHKTRVWLTTGSASFMMSSGQFWLVFYYFGLANGDGLQTGHERNITPLYMMHLSREKLIRYNLPQVSEFTFDMVNNDSRLLPDYRLHSIHGLSITYVSLLKSLVLST